ncbi:MAG: family 43 glycosylhydrolase [Bacilli bacterium]|nr:family 43 glycosylhydrolase [Bacilli bacterium]
MKRITSFAIILLVLLLVGCQQNKKTIKGTFSYKEQFLSKDKNYNSNLYYLNTLEFQVADPSVIYIEEGPEAGYFYAYGTSDDIRVYGFQSWRSKDLTHWESMGVAFKPDFNNTWATINYWAPEVIYDPQDKLYYMFYNAQTMGSNLMQLSVAYSENPQGPFISPDKIRNADGKMLYANQPVFDFTSNNPAINKSIARRHAIDASPFIDPVTGEKYMYFSYYDSFNQSEIFGVKMKDWFTPDYSTLTQLTAVGYLSLEAARNNDINQRVPEGTINEGPFMYYKDGTYYLTLSVYGYTDEKYQVRQALSNHPLGTFMKIAPEKGGTVIATDSMWSHVTSAGHHSFVQVGDELMIAYHTFLNRTDISEGRALAFDHVILTEKYGQKVLHTNGPTYSLQPLPELISGYKNIAPLAKITANNTASDSNVRYLNDGIMSYLSYDSIPEYRANEGVSRITLTFDDFMIARNIMIYNSIWYEDSFLDVAEVNLYVKKDTKGNTEKVTIKDLDYDWDWHVDGNINAMRPGGAVIVEFAEIPINKIEIVISSVKDYMLGIPEIVVLGKEGTNLAPVTEFTEYSYENPVPVSPALVIEGHTIGSNGLLKTNFGYDVTHDDGTENAYIIQNWPYDQYAYFKDIWSTKFYVEAYFTVTNQKSYANDPYPKFGLTVASPENTIFYFVDANPTYTKDAIGVAQRKLDNSDWDWNATEQNVANVGISYRDGNFVKLAIIRDGAEFYLLANDKLYIYYDQFNVFTEDYNATVGFLTFNTELLIKNYYATQDSNEVDQKIRELVPKSSGETFGSSSSYRTTPGWNLSTDDGTEDAYIENTTIGDQYAYFKDFNENTFYAQVEATVIRDLGDPYPKFGFALQNNGYTLFYFVDAINNYTNQVVGYVLRTPDNTWHWESAKFINAPDIKYKDGEYVKLAILRDGANISFYANDTLITTVTNIEGFGANNKSVVSFLTFTTGVRITNYQITTNIESINLE